MNSFALAAARAKKQDSLTPDSKKSLEKKLLEIVNSGDLPLESPKESSVSVGETVLVLTLYPIKCVATALDRTATSIRSWEADKIIPKATFRDDKSGKRFYHPLQIALLVHLARKHDIRQGRNLKGSVFSQDVIKLWPQVRQMILTPKEKTNG